VMSGGRIVAVLTADEATRDRVGELMTAVNGAREQVRP